MYLHESEGADVLALVGIPTLAATRRNGVPAGQPSREARRTTGPQQDERATPGTPVESHPRRPRGLRVELHLDPAQACPVLTLTYQSGLGRAHARHRGVRLPIPLPELDELTPQWVAERLMVAPGLPRGLHGHERRSALARLLANLVAAFVEYDMERVEIDPLLETRHGFVVGGVSIVLDERAAFRRPRALTGGGSPAPHPFWDVAAAPIIYTPLEGEVCVVTGGRALALLLQDALLDLGSPAACVVDVGCGCDRVRADAAMRLLLERTYHEGRCRSALVVLGPTVSSAPDVLQGLIGPLAGGGCAPLRTIVLLPGAAEGSPAVPPLPPELVLAPDLRTAIRWAARP